VLAGRTLLQQALPVTFGLKAAGWLTGVERAEARLGELAGALPAQLGGAAGTLASLRGPAAAGASGEGEPAGPAVLAAFADELGLAEPVLPWHTLRTPVAELGAALGVAAGALGKIVQDLVLLAQTEVAEIVPSGEGPGWGGSSTMPHKRNPVAAVLALAAARRTPGLVSTLLTSMVSEHERAAGAWHAEWETLRELLGLVGGAAAAAGDALDGLAVDGDRAASNLDATGGLLLAENVTTALVPALGRLAAHDLVTEACRRAVAEARPLRAVLLDEPAVTEHLSPSQVDDALDPARALGAAGVFVDRVLAARGGASGLTKGRG
jgi:3-carboxy-cis,cis-muconate cycloisomerase